MPGWSRREVLAALAAGAVSAPGWSALLGCGGARQAAAPPPAPPPIESIAGLRAQLRRVALDLERRFARVAIRAEVGQLTSVRVEAEDQALEQRGRTSLRVAGVDRTGWVERVSEDLTPAGIDRAAAALVAASSRARARASAADAERAARGLPAPAADIPGPRMAIDPRARPASEWLERAARLLARAGRVGGSRLVYRAATVEIDDGEVLFVGGGVDRAQRLVRARARALFLAWTGRALIGEEATRAGALGLEVAQIDDGQLARAARGALTLFTSGGFDPGPRELVLDPSVTALVVREAARGLESDVWARGGARAAPMRGRTLGGAGLTLRDDPTAEGSYGGYRFDDEGAEARPAALLERGVLVGALCDRAGADRLGQAPTGHGRRATADGPIEPRAAHLVVEPGARSLDELVASVAGQGFLLESGVDGRGDPASWRIAVRARRAREIEGGRLTGRVYGPVVMAGDAPALLAGARAIGRELESRGWREGGLALSATTPALVTRGWLGGAGP